MKYIIIIFLSISSLFGCSSKEPTKTIEPSDYILGAGDRLVISVFQEPDMQMRLKIHSGGKLNFPYIGEVVCAGRTAREIEKDIENRLKDGVIKQPSVTVTIEKFRDFYIGGQVEAPGKYEFEAGLTVEKAIMIAGGVTDRGDATDVNVRLAQTGELKEDVEPTFPIGPGDTIYIEMSFF